MGKSKRERLEEIFRRLALLPACGSHTEAKKQMDDVIIQVEDELSGIPYDLAASLSDGRLYPVLEDNRRPVPGRADITRYRSREHNTFIRENGAMEVRSYKNALGQNADPPQDGVLVWSKPGVDGKGVWES